jgi:hypothetical protein
MNDAVPAGLPAGYQQVAHLSFGDHHSRLWWLLNVLSIITLLIGVTVFFVSGMALGGSFRGEFDPLSFVFVVLSVVLTTFAHEAVHGLAMRSFGARPVYGFKLELGAAYCAAPGHAFTRSQFFVMVLAPLVVVTIVFFGLMLGTLTWPVWQLFALGGAFNITGAIGDLYMTVYLLRQPASAYVVDELDGIRVFARPGATERPGTTRPG